MGSSRWGEVIRLGGGAIKVGGGVISKSVEQRREAVEGGMHWTSLSLVYIQYTDICLHKHMSCTWRGTQQRHVSVHTPVQTSLQLP